MHASIGTDQRFMPADGRGQSISRSRAVRRAAQRQYLGVVAAEARRLARQLQPLRSPAESMIDRPVRAETTG